MESAAAYLKSVIKNDNIKVRIVDGMNPSISSDITCSEWEKLTAAIRETWSGVVVSPYLMMACSDSRPIAVSPTGCTVSPPCGYPKKNAV